MRAKQQPLPRVPARQPQPLKAQKPQQPQQPPKGTNPSSQVDTLTNIFNQRKLPLMLVGITSLIAGLYFSVTIASFLKSLPCACPGPHDTTTHHPLEPTGRPRSLDAQLAQSKTSAEARQTATKFDRELNFPEFLTGIRGLRRKLAARARGHVLEVAVGTGRNLPWYDWSEVIASDEDEARRERERARVRKLLEMHSWAGTKMNSSSKESGGGDGAGGVQPGDLDGEIVSLTGVDISADMLLVARQHLRDAVPGLDRMMAKKRTERMPTEGEAGLVVDVLDHRLRLVKMDAQEMLPAAPEVPGCGRVSDEGRYDTVVQTFGLCSVKDPVRLLTQMAAAVRPDTGRILLLEHGRGSWEWVNEKLLDRFADQHFRKYGCWWNRDIEGVVREAAERVPGLEVVKFERPKLSHGGTTILVELKVNRNGGKAKIESQDQLSETGWRGLISRITT